MQICTLQSNILTCAHTCTFIESHEVVKADAVRVRFPKKDALIKLQKLTAGSPHHFQDAIIEDHKSIFIYDPYQSDMTDMHGTDVALIFVQNCGFQTN